MTPMIFTRRPVALLALLVCLLGLVSFASRDRAVASPNSVHTGLGLRGGGEFIGYYVTRTGTKVYCLIPRKGTPPSVSLRTVSRYPGLSSAASGALSYALATWGDARSRRAAAVESQVVNTLAGNTRDVARRNRHLPASLRRLVSAHVAQARSMRGPYALRVATPGSPLPGGSASGTVRLVSATGHAVAGVRVDLRASANARVPAAVRTDRHGSARFRYSVSDVGEVRVSATASGLSGTAIRVSSPRPGQQRMAAPTGRVTVHGSAVFRGTAAGFAHRYACTTDCAGRPLVTLTACAPASRVASRIVYRFAGQVVISAFAPSARRHCATTKVIAPDGAVVTGAWQFATAHRWSTPIGAGGTFLVDCPAPAAVTVSMVYDCTRASVTIGLARPGVAVPAPNAAARRAVLVISGARAARVYADPGRSATWTVSVPCGAHATLTFASGVQRRDGTWNYGRPASLITP